MTEAIGIRLDDETLKRIESLSKEELTDRSTTIRRLIEEGYRSTMRRKSAEGYKKGEYTISEAAKKADMSLWDMEQYLVREGYKSTYAIEDLKREVNMLRDS